MEDSSKIIDGKKYYYVSFDKYETELDENNIKYRIEYIRNGDFKICKKVMSTIKIEKKKVKIPKGVYERSKWKSFGIENNDGVTTLGDYYSLNFSTNENTTNENTTNENTTNKNKKNETTKSKKKIIDKKEHNYDRLILQVSNIPSNTSCYDIYKLLSVHGCLEALYMPTDNITKLFKGYCFAKYNNVEICKRMHTSLDNHVYGYTRLNVEIK
jgi:hypothetical protein